MNIFESSVYSTLLSTYRCTTYLVSLRLFCVCDRFGRRRPTTHVVVVASQISPALIFPSSPFEAPNVSATSVCLHRRVFVHSATALLHRKVIRINFILHGQYKKHTNVFKYFLRYQYIHYFVLDVGFLDPLQSYHRADHIRLLRNKIHIRGLEKPLSPGRGILTKPCVNIDKEQIQLGICDQLIHLVFMVR